MAARIPGARLAALEGDIHIPEFGDPAGVIQAIREFVGNPVGHGPTELLGLSARELEVLGFIAAGLSNPEIAARLHISVHTIERHAVNLYAKLGVHRRSDATAYALQHHVRLASPTTTT